MAILEIGTVFKGKHGLFLKFEQPKDKNGKLFGKNAVQLFPMTCADGTVISEGDIVSLEDPRESITRLLNGGYINEETAAMRVASLPDTVSKKAKINLDKLGENK